MDNKVDQRGIKEYNKKQILSLLRKKGEMVKRELARELNISVPTVITNTNELMQDGIIEEAGVAHSTGGRKPVMLRFLKNSRFAFGVDIQIEKVRIVLLNLNYEIVCDRSFEFDRSYQIDELMQKISGEVAKILTAMAVLPEKIIGIGFSLPGTINEAAKMLEVAPNLGLSYVDFNAFQPLFDFPIFVENESNAAAYAEYKVGVCQACSDMVYVSLNKGVGAGIIADKSIYKGHNKRAGEIGHMTIHKNGSRCVCGKQGCWNAYVSVYHLLDAYNADSPTKIRTLREFFQLYHTAEERACRLWDNYIDDLIVGIQNIMLIFDPNYIILGGEMATYAEELLAPISEKLYDDLEFFSEKDINIMASSLREDASVIGAALIPLGMFMDVDEAYNGI